MRTQITVYFLFIFSMALISCSEKQTEPKVLILQSEYSKVQDIKSMADCYSPFGQYTTEVHSLSDGSCYFHQKFSDSEQPFIIRLDSLNNGYIMNDEDTVIDTLSVEDVEMIRGHEIHKMSMDPEWFFKNISFDKDVTYLEEEYELYLGQDHLENPVYLTYNPKKKQISKIELLNPRDTTQTIEILYKTWKKTNFGYLVRMVDIVQAKKDTFNFNFKSIEITDTKGDRVVIDDL